MGIPPAQFVRGRNIPKPEIDLGLLFRQAARPKAVNQDPVTVAASRRFVNSFHLDHTVTTFEKPFVIVQL
jgi:hypothetical protein